MARSLAEEIRLGFERVLRSITQTVTGTVTVQDGGGSVSVDDGGSSLTVDGTVGATQSGTWNVNNVSGTVSLPTGAATETTLASVDGKLPALSGGAVPVQPAQTSGGCLAHHVISAASTNATNVKASAGQVYAIIVRNTAGAVRKIAFHNNSGTPTAGAGIYFVIILNNTAAPVTYTWPTGVAFSSGIAYTMVTGSANSDATAVGANEIYMELFYK